MHKQMIQLAAVALALMAAPLSSVHAQAAQATAAPKAGAMTVNPVGSFGFSAQMGDHNGTGTIDIAKKEGQLGGTVTLDGAEPPTVPIKSVTVDGQVLTVVVETPGGDAEFKLTFAGDDFSGMLTMGPNQAPITGKRAAAAKS
jgi:hypothetical protein